MVVGNNAGALLINKRTVYALDPEHREIVSRLVKQYAARLVQLTRQDNAEAVRVLNQSGITLIPPSPEQTASFKQNAEKNYKMSIPSLYSQALFDQVRGLLVEYKDKVN